MKSKAFFSVWLFCDASWAFRILVALDSRNTRNSELSSHKISQFANIHLPKNIVNFTLVRFLLPFWRIFLHIVASTPGRWSFGSTCLQSVIERVLLSNGSAHFGSESDRHSQHFIAYPKIQNFQLVFPQFLSEFNATETSNSLQLDKSTANFSIFTFFDYKSEQNYSTNYKKVSTFQHSADLN